MMVGRRLVLTEMLTGCEVAAAPRSSVAFALSVYMPAATLGHVMEKGVAVALPSSVVP